VVDRPPNQGDLKLRIRLVGMVPFVHVRGFSAPPTGIPARA
jgi:hypothetical protein